LRENPQNSCRRPNPPLRPHARSRASILPRLRAGKSTRRSLELVNPCRRVATPDRCPLLRPQATAPLHRPRIHRSTPHGIMRLVAVCSPCSSSRRRTKWSSEMPLARCRSSATSSRNVSDSGCGRKSCGCQLVAVDLSSGINSVSAKWSRLFTICPVGGAVGVSA
jgi:hypothetical protein